MHYTRWETMLVAVGFGFLGFSLALGGLDPKREARPGGNH
jgi:hypothetical protein